MHEIWIHYESPLLSQEQMSDHQLEQHKAVKKKKWDVYPVRPRGPRNSNVDPVTARI